MNKNKNFFSKEVVKMAEKHAEKYAFIAEQIRSLSNDIDGILKEMESNGLSKKDIDELSKMYNSTAKSKMSKEDVEILEDIKLF